VKRNPLANIKSFGADFLFFGLILYLSIPHLILSFFYSSKPTQFEFLLRFLFPSFLLYMCGVSHLNVILVLAAFFVLSSFFLFSLFPFIPS